MQDFNEQNRQISTPSLLLKQERLERNVEVQKGIYLTLKQQLELAKIEEVQEASIVQILDFPQAPLGPFNRNLKLTIVVSFVVGTGLGIILGFIRSYLIQQDNIDERRKLRRVKTYLKKKGKDIILDRRIFGIISIALTVGLPFYLGHQSTNPVFFGRFSSTMMLINSIYVTTLIISLLFFFRLSNKSKA